MGKAFVKALRACSGPDRAEELVVQYAPHLDPQAVTALGSRLADVAALNSGTGTGQLCQVRLAMRRTWLPLFRAHLHRMDAAGLCICVQSAAKVFRGAASSGGGDQHGASSRDSSSSGESNSSSWGGSSSDDGWEVGGRHRTSSSSSGGGGGDDLLLLDEPTLEGILLAVDAQLRGFTPRSASQLLWGLATLRCRPAQRWLDRFVTVALPTASLGRAVAPRDLAITMWSLGAMRSPPPQRWLAAAIDAAAGGIGAWDAQQVGLLVWSLAAMRVSPGEELLETVVARAGELLEEHGRWKECVAAQQQRQQQPRGWCALAEPCCSQGDGTCSVCAQQQRVVPPPAAPLVRGWGHEDDAVGGGSGSGRASRPFPAAALAQLCYALCMLRHTPAPHFAELLMDAVMDAPAAAGGGGTASGHVTPPPLQPPSPSLAPPPALLSSLGAREVLLLLMALSHWRTAAPSAPWAAQLFAASEARLAGGSGHAAAGALWCAAQLHLRPPGPWVDACIAALERDAYSHHDNYQHHRLPPLAAARALRALGALGYAPPRATGAALLSVVAAHVAQLPAKHLFPALGAAALLRVRPAGAKAAAALLAGPQRADAPHARSGGGGHGLERAGGGGRQLLPKYAYASGRHLAQHAAAAVAWRWRGTGEHWLAALMAAAHDAARSGRASPGELADLVACVPQLAVLAAASGAGDAAASDRGSEPGAGAAGGGSGGDEGDAHLGAQPAAAPSRSAQPPTARPPLSPPDPCAPRTRWRRPALKLVEHAAARAGELSLGQCVRLARGALALGLGPSDGCVECGRHDGAGPGEGGGGGWGERVGGRLWHLLLLGEREPPRGEADSRRCQEQPGVASSSSKSEAGDATWAPATMGSGSGVDLEAHARQLLPLLLDERRPSCPPRSHGSSYSDSTSWKT
ncbi:hypothetical protein FOA52_014843 [Chlamydomonas sp. UWO 241]|nr:hypothetical protein FOA52_014843 [Chlamydomonas sp. UWO 241]